ncbi:MAG: hypothetical protein ACE5IY_13260 [bacterium]
MSRKNTSFSGEKDRQTPAGAEETTERSRNRVDSDERLSDELRYWQELYEDDEPEIKFRERRFRGKGKFKDTEFE